MIIGKKQLVTPVNVEVMQDNEMISLFRDRSLLHNGKIPAFTIYIRPQTWNSFLLRAADEYSSHRNEASGIILGYYLCDEFGKYIVGTHFEPGTGDSTNSVFCEISVQDQLRIIRTSEQKKLLQAIWIHSHPSLGAFYSTVDYRTLRSMYYAPHQAGIVVDNVKQEYMGFKVLNQTPSEFKDIWLVNLDGKVPQITKPFGKDPVKTFYARTGYTASATRKRNDSVSLKPHLKNNLPLTPEIIEKFEKLISALRMLIPDRKCAFNIADPLLLACEQANDELEKLLIDQWGDLPYKNVAPLIKLLDDIRSLLKNGLSANEENEMKANLDKLQDRLNEHVL